MKKELETQVNEVKKSTSRIKEHMDAFDTFFKSEVSKRASTKALEELYYEFIDLAYKHTTLYTFILDKIVDVENNIRQTLTPKQKEEFEAYEYLTNEFSDDFGLQSFIYGYALGQELQIESNIVAEEILPNLKEILNKSICMIQEKI